MIGRSKSVSHKFFGIITRKERWGLSIRGWSVLILATFFLVFTFTRSAYPFLAITSRADSDILVVEGWIHEYAIRAAVAEFKSNSYQRVFSTGGPVSGTGGYINDFNTSASVGADRLLKYGLSKEQVQMAPSRVIDRDRTYSAAVALREWFAQHDLPVRSINVVTEDLHARRSRLLFQKAFGNGVVIGVIAVPNIDYDAKRWWRYSQGVKDVISEGAAYLYVRFSFHPNN